MGSYMAIFLNVQESCKIEFDPSKITPARKSSHDFNGVVITALRQRRILPR